MRNPPALDFSSFAAYQASQRRANIGTFPESELRQGYAEQPDGSVGQYKGSTEVINAAIGRGQIKRDYSNIRVPVLAFIDYPLAPGEGLNQSGYQPLNDVERAAMAAYARVTKKRIDKRIDNLTRSVPTARVVKLPGASHYVFLTREAEVLAEMHRFVATLK